jgi:precorrin-6Y C5,15-methyltransferase (decarboxylating)
LKEILIFAGTTEGRKLSEYLSEREIYHTVCVATEYGEIVLNKSPFMTVHRGRMNQNGIKDFIEKGNFSVVVDATHPYAHEVTRNIKSAATTIPYLRLKRELDNCESENIVKDNAIYFDTNEACAKFLESTKGNILLTTGSKELGAYCISENIKSRLFVRVLPSVESISLCIEHGIQGKQIIAMQGPFTAKMNEAIISQYDISCIVTKQSGVAGGYIEKLEAARAKNIPIYVIGHSKEEEGYSFRDICEKLEKICGNTPQHSFEMRITLAGVGMGNKGSMTNEVQEKINEADIILGAERLIEPFHPRLEKKPFYMASEIIPYLKGLHVNSLQGNLNIVILFSGDTGFYSGCKSLYQALQEEVNSGQLKAKLQIMSGISSVAYLASCIGEDYQESAVYSIHGRKVRNLANRIRTSKSIFLLTSGVKDINQIGKILIDSGLSECEVVAGYQLSYPEQEITRLTPRECLELSKEGLYTCYIRNTGWQHKRLTHGIADSEFIRDKVPMTKEEVREVSICKLSLYQGAVVYDIGSGTGSIAIEIARISDDIQVYAIEHKKEAVALIDKNKQKFGLENIEVIEAHAPNGLDKLPKATHAFIGGSGGEMKEILPVLYNINPNMRVVINAVSMETISEINYIMANPQIINAEVVQLQVSRANAVGQHHLMKAENPVWICSFTFTDKV